ncbi:uncharacterized protein LOC143851134 [Tasmannia lanceolata]|uniref:uncharacterized protein LOC143851134 n=1 Tax=Tasmannia lanceolata TaxID=3420 RepID=UPI0040630528
MEEEEEEEEETEKTHQNQVLTVLEALKEASQKLQNEPKNTTNSYAIKALLELEPESNIFYNDSNLCTLSQHLSHLKTLVQNLHNSEENTGIRSYFRRRAIGCEISSIAGLIETEIQAWIDREKVENLVKALAKGEDEEEKVKLLIELENRVSQGFDRELQEVVLKSKVFSELESVLCNPIASKRIRERSAFVIAGLVQFNKNVFVGEVLMGRTVRAVITMGSASSLQVLCSLIRSIKSPLVDEIQSNGEIPKIISFLDSDDMEIRMVAMDCVVEIGYFGRKEAIEGMIEEGLVRKLVEMQRSRNGGDLIEMGRFEENEDEVFIEGVEIEPKRKKSKERRFIEKHPFASCVARFAIQLEVGEGLRQREKRAFKQEVLRRVREATVSDAEAATILAEVLWGSSP